MNPGILRQQTMQSISCMVFLKSGVLYVWKQGDHQSNQKEYSVGTWANKCSYCQILKFGTELDKLLLKEPTIGTRQVLVVVQRERDN